MLEQVDKSWPLHTSIAIISFPMETQQNSEQDQVSAYTMHKTVMSWIYKNFPKWKALSPILVYKLSLSIYNSKIIWGWNGIKRNSYNLKEWWSETSFQRKKLFLASCKWRPSSSVWLTMRTIQMRNEAHIALLTYHFISLKSSPNLLSMLLKKSWIGTGDMAHGSRSEENTLHFQRPWVLFPEPTPDSSQLPLNSSSRKSGTLFWLSWALYSDV